jgi:hypothetical protein
MTAAQKLAMEMLSLEAIDLYIVSEEVKDAFEDEMMRKDVQSWEGMALAVKRAKLA